MTHEAFRIRPKNVDDDVELVRVLLAVHAHDGWPRVLRDPARFVTPPYERAAWVAEQDGQVVGHVALHDAAVDPTLDAAQRATGLGPEGLAVIARLFVYPDARRSGAGRALLETAHEAARAHEQVPVLDVVQDAHAAIALYEHLGWRRLEPLRLDLRDAVLDLWVYLGPA